MAVCNRSDPTDRQVAIRSLAAQLFGAQAIQPFQLKFDGIADGTDRGFRISVGTP